MERNCGVSFQTIAFFKELLARHRNGYPIGAGYRIAPMNRDCFRVTHESGRSVDVYAELLSGNHGRHLSTKLPSFWNAPHNNEELDENRKIEVIERVRLFFQNMGCKIELKP